MKNLLKIILSVMLFLTLGCGKKESSAVQITPTSVEYNAYKVVHHMSEVIKHIKKFGVNSFDFPVINEFNGIGMSADLDNFHSKAIADLREGPVVITTPASGERYSSIQIVDQEHFTIFDKVLSDEERFVLVKEDYTGDIPKGTVVKTKSNFPYIFVRTQSYNQNEDREADALRRKITITHSRSEIKTPSLDSPEAILKWSNMNSLPYAETRPLLVKAESSYSSKVHKGTINYLEQYVNSGAVFDNRGMFEAINDINGGDDKTRAAGVMLGHLGMPAEEIYLQKITLDHFGNPLSGDSGPVVVMMPYDSGVEHFWSITLHDATTNLPVTKKQKHYHNGNTEPDFNGNVRFTFSMTESRDGSYWIPVESGAYYFTVRYYGPKKGLNGNSVYDSYFEEEPELTAKHKPIQF